MRNDEFLPILREFYIPLKIYLNKLKKFKGSCLPIIITSTSNKLKEIFKESSKFKHSFNKDIVKKLIEEKYIIEFDNSGKYILSARGIWFYERYELKFPENYLLDEITNNSIKKTYKSNKKFSDAWKLILFSIFTMRSFSKATSINLLIHKRLDDWLDMFKKTNSFLVKKKIIKNVDLDKKAGLQHRLQLLVQKQSGELRKATSEIYTGSGKAEFWLDIIDKEGNIEPKKVEYILKEIFGIISMEFKREILEFSNEILKEYSIKIFDKLEFTSLKTSREIKKIVMS